MPNYDATADVLGSPFIGGSLTALTFNPQVTTKTSVQTIQIQFPGSPNIGCVSFAAWLTGDTRHYRTQREANFTICPTELNLVLSQRALMFNATRKSVSAQWINKTVDSSRPAGLIVVRAGICCDRLYQTTPADYPWMNTPGPLAVPDVGREGWGYTMIINLMQVRATVLDVRVS